MINKDVRNNSAWNHRFVVLQWLTKQQLKWDWKLEETFVLSQSFKAASNECPYTYYQALLRLANKRLEEQPAWLEWVDQVVREANTMNKINMPARSMWIDCLIATHQFDLAKDHCLQMSREYDPIRARYWKWKAA
jgi:hypothetical protein